MDTPASALISDYWVLQEEELELQSILLKTDFGHQDEVSGSEWQFGPECPQYWATQDSSDRKYEIKAGPLSEYGQ